jgi:hypothetical protein
MSIKQEDREDRTRRRAYQMWLDAGMPERGSIEFWQEAEDQEAAEEVQVHSRLGENFPSSDPEGFCRLLVPEEPSQHQADAPGQRRVTM